jgi:hypothetical protein
MRKYSITVTLDCVVEVEAEDSQEAEEKINTALLQGDDIYEITLPDKNNLKLEVVNSWVDNGLTFEITDEEGKWYDRKKLL